MCKKLHLSPAYFASENGNIETSEHANGHEPTAIEATCGVVMDPEDQSARNARVDKLWQTLDTQNEGQLDINGLKKGLSKMDHRKSLT